MNLLTLAIIISVMGGIAVIETVIPLHRRGPMHRAHLGPNLGLTLLTFLTNMILNTGVLALLLWLDGEDAGLLRWLSIEGLAAAIIGIVALDLTWYALHRTMHRVPALWRIHRVHHADPVIDVTTTIRQHPAESLLRYASIVACAGGLGVGVGAFAVYRVWSALNGLAEHANVRMPRRLDRTLALAVVSPDMHKVHHSRDSRETDTNYGNIFSMFDRVFGTFTPTERGRSVVCGLDGHDEPAQQTFTGLLAMPF